MSHLDTHHHGDDGTDSSVTVSPTATDTENTPLLSSGSSSITVQDDSPAREQQASPVDASEKRLGWKRTACIVASMWVLIFPLTSPASNMSGMSTAQSTIAADLDAYESAMWFTSAYMISMSSVAPLAGRLSMIFSSATMILLSSGCFAVGAMVTALAPSFGVFILGRVLLGIGSGGIMTLCMIVVIQLTSQKRRGLWIGLTNAGFTIGVSAGAIVFGALLPVLGWRLLFGAQAPLAAIAGLGVTLSIPRFATDEHVKDRTTRQKLAGIDYAGAASLTITIVLFLYGLSGTIQPLPILLSLLSLALFLLVESRASDPVIPLAVIRSRGVLLSCFSQLGFMAARWTVLFYAPMFVLAVRGLSPAIAGSVLVPTNAGFGLGGLLVGALHIRHAGSFWLGSLLSLAAFSLALFALSFFSNAEASVGVYVVILFANGLGTGAALTYTLAHLLHLTRPEVHFIVTGLLSTFRGFAGSFGTAIGGGVFTRTLRDALTEGFRRFDGGEQLDKAREKLITVLIGSPAAVWQGGVLNAAERVVAVTGYERAMDVLYKSAAAMCVLVLVMQAGTGWAAPAGVKDEDEEFEEFEEAVAESDRAMEA